ncbi:MAG: hypothetical protein ABJB17_08395, partial [Burkholderiales bacterium]
MRTQLLQARTPLASCGNRLHPLLLSAAKRADSATVFVLLLFPFSPGCRMKLLMIDNYDSFTYN